MKIYFFYSVTVLLAVLAESISCCMAADECGAISNNVQLCINLKEPGRTRTNNEPVVLVFQVKNFSTNDSFNFLHSEIAGQNPAISLVVVSPSGKSKSPDTSPFKLVQVGRKTVLPDQTLEFEFKFSDVCRLDEAGTFEVTSKLELNTTGKRHSFAVTSNTLKLSCVW
jgi:hypothetical protein